MFNLNKFVLDTLINGVKNNIFSREYAGILATNYLIKGVLDVSDLQKFDEATKVKEVTEQDNTATEDEVTESEVAESTSTEQGDK